LRQKIFSEPHQPQFLWLHHPSPIWLLLVAAAAGQLLQELPGGEAVAQGAIELPR
jgi:hypothetical protein